MEWQTLINIGAGSVLSFMCWGVKTTWTKITENDKAITEVRIEMAKDYVSHADLADIKNSLLRIETKLDGKADK